MKEELANKGHVFDSSKEGVSSEKDSKHREQTKISKIIKPIVPGEVISAKERRKREAELRNQKNLQSQPALKEIKSIDLKLASLNIEKNKLEDQLVSGAKATDLAAIGKRLKEIQNEVTDQENRWIELQDIVEKA